MRLPALVFGICIYLASCTSPVEYDVLITNGIIYHGSGEKPYSGSVAINGARIEVIGTLANAMGKVTFDAKGKAVAPRCINILNWANVSLLEDGCSQDDIRQGVTPELMGKGSSMDP